MNRKMAKDDNGKQPANEQKEDDNDKFLCLDKEMIPCKMVFFTHDASWSSLFSYLTLFYVESGITVAHTGFMYGITIGVSLLSHPLWGGLIDSAVKYRTLLLMVLSFSTISLEFIRPWIVMWVSKVEPNTTYTAGRNETSVHLLNPIMVLYAVTVNGILASIAIAGLITFMEGAVIKTVFTRKTTYSYGEQKVFGPIGKAIGTFIAGVAVDHYKPQHMSRYVAAFYVYLPLSLLMVPFMYKLSKQANWDYGTKKRNKEKRSLGIHVLKSLKKPYILMFLISSFISGVASCIVGSYMFLFMKDKMHPSKTMMALTTVAASVSELFVYPLTSKIIRLCGGHMRSIIFASFMYSLRLVLLSFCPSPGFVIAIQLLLYGLSYSLIWSAMIELTYMIYPKEITNTAIGLLTSFHFVAPGVIAHVFGGLMYHHYGGAILFRGVAIMNAVWCVVMILYFIVVKGDSIPDDSYSYNDDEKGLLDDDMYVNSD